MHKILPGHDLVVPRKGGFCSIEGMEIRGCGHIGSGAFGRMLNESAGSCGEGDYYQTGD